MNITGKQAKFISEYTKDFNATQAAIRAWYSEKTAYSIGQRLLKKPVIQKALEADLIACAERLTITADDVIRDLIMIKENCMDKRHFDARGAIRALELIGKHLGMFTSKIQVEDNTEKKFIFCWQGEDDDERASWDFTSLENDRHRSPTSTLIFCAPYNLSFYFFDSPQLLVIVAWKK